MPLRHSKMGVWILKRFDFPVEIKNKSLAMQGL